MRCSVVLNLHWLRRFPITLRDEVDWWFIARPGLMADGMVDEMFGKPLADLSRGIEKHQFLMIHNLERMPTVVGPVRNPTEDPGAAPQRWPPE